MRPNERKRELSSSSGLRVRIVRADTLSTPSMEAYISPYVSRVADVALLRPEYVHFGIWIDLILSRSELLDFYWNDPRNEANARGALHTLMVYVRRACAARLGHPDADLHEGADEMCAIRRIVNEMNPEVANQIFDFDYVDAFFISLRLFRAVSDARLEREGDEKERVRYQNDLSESYHAMNSAKTLADVMRVLTAFAETRAERVGRSAKSDAARARTIEADAFVRGENAEVKGMESERLKRAKNLKIVTRRDDSDSGSDSASNSDTDADSDTDSDSDFEPESVVTIQSVPPIVPVQLPYRYEPNDAWVRSTVARLHPAVGKLYSDDPVAMLLAAACVDALPSVDALRNEPVNSTRTMQLVKATVEKRRNDRGIREAALLGYGIEDEGMVP